MFNVDRVIVEFDKGLRTLFSQAHSAHIIPMPMLLKVRWMPQKSSMRRA